MALTWAQQTGHGLRDVVSIAYGAGVFVAAGQCYTNTMGIAYSATGLTPWTAGTGGTTPSASSLSQFVCFVNSKFFHGVSNYLKTSTDGITWTDISTGTLTGVVGTFSTFEFVAYGAGLYVVAGTRTSGATTVLTSPDLVTWTTLSAGSAAVGSLGAYLEVIWDSSRSIFLAAASRADSLNHIIAKSSDGLTWSLARNVADTVVGYHAIAVGNGYIFNTGRLSSPTSLPITSTDTTTWSATSGHDFIASSLCYRFAYHAPYYFLGGTTNLGVCKLQTSTNLTTWENEPHLFGTTGIVKDFALATFGGNDVYVAVGRMMVGIPIGEIETAVVPSAVVASTAMTFARFIDNGYVDWRSEV